MENLIGRYVEASSTSIINEIFNHYVNKNVYITKLYELTNENVNEKDLILFGKIEHIKNHLIFINEDQIDHMYMYVVKQQGTYFCKTNEFDKYFLNPNEFINWFFYISDGFYINLELKRQNLHYYVLNLYSNHIGRGRLVTEKTDNCFAKMGDYYFQLMHHNCSFLQHPACVKVIETLKEKLRTYEPLINSIIFLKRLSV